jgi:hypothetical protein
MSHTEAVLTDTEVKIVQAFRQAKLLAHVIGSPKEESDKATYDLYEKVKNCIQNEDADTQAALFEVYRRAVLNTEGRDL